MPQFINSIEYTDTEGSKVTLDGITSVSTVDAGTLSVTSAVNATNIIPDENGAVNPLGRKADSAVGVNSTALGNNSNASADSSTALGYDSTASNSQSTAVGHGSTASGAQSTAIGYGSTASGAQSTALGDGSTASGAQSTALGDATASGNYCTALGHGSGAGDSSSTALGSYAIAPTYSATALGSYAEASGRESVALGRDSEALGDSSVALGREAEASTTSSTALGAATNALGVASTAVGILATASGGNSTALGAAANASGGNSIALGYRAGAVGMNSAALGPNATTSDADSNTVKLGDNALSALICVVNLTVTSDERDKTDIEGLTDALALVERLNPVTFVSNDRVEYISDEDKNSETFRKYGMCEYDRVSHAAGTKKGERRRCGLLAQEVVEAMQSVYGTDNYANVVNDNFHDLTEKPSDVENKYTLAYANLVPFLIGAIKELNAKIKVLEGKLATSGGASAQED